MQGVRSVDLRGTARWVVVVLAALLLVFGSLAAVRPAAASPGEAALSGAGPAESAVKTADLSRFQPGNIISDQVFFDRSTMTAGQIQSFLESKVPTCQAGYTCLKDWYDTSRTTNADAMCAAYSGGVRERASTIIYKVAQACGINPQVLIVTLQKEQALVTHTWPSNWRYTIAMGQGCPDTAACDTRYYGFFNQVYGAAWQFKRYGNPPGTSNYFTWYAPGRTWNVLYNPNAACGSSPVYIQNQATANLYYYTPYQPNAAALRAGYGEGDACSAYGNRNFYNYFTDWFGSVSGELLQVLRVSGTEDRYLVSGGARWKFPSAELASQYTWIATSRDVGASEIASYRDMGTAKRAVRTPSGAVYVLDSGQRLRLRDCDQAADFGWSCSALPTAGENQVARYRDGGMFERVIRSSGVMWLVQSSGKREIVDLGLLPRYGIPALATDVSPMLAADYPAAQPVLGDGVYRDASGRYRVQTAAGVYDLPAAASGTSLASSARQITTESMEFLKPATTLPVRLSSEGRSFVLTESGWLEVSTYEYPGRLAFTPLPAGATTGIPVVGRETRPHFIRERSDSQVYLVSWGTLQAVTPADQAWVVGTYGINPRVWVGLDGVIEDGSAGGSLARTSSGAFYLLDGMRAYRLRDCGHATAWGADCPRLPVISDATLAGFANAGTLRDLVRTPAGTIWLAQGGRLRQVLDPGILAVYGISSTTSALSAATVAKFPVGEPVLAAGVYSDGGATRAAVTEGGEYSLSPEQAVGVMRSARALTAESFAKISIDGPLPSRMRSDGRSFVLTEEGWLEVAAPTYGGDALFTQLPSRAWKGIAIAGNEPRPHFVRGYGGTQEYLVSGGVAQPVSGAAERTWITSTFGVPPKVWPLAGGSLTGVRIPYELFVKGPAGEIYLIDGATRYRASGCSVVADYGKDCAALRTLTAAEIAGKTDGGSLAPLLKSPEGYVWLAQGGAKREVPDPRLLAVYGIGGATTAVSAEVMAQLPLGQPVVAVGAYDDRAGDVRVIDGDGRTFTVPAAARIGSIVSQAWRISPASIDLLKAEGDLPLRMKAGAQADILTSEGWLAVDANAYAPLSFAALGPAAAQGLPSAGSETRPHFVREQSSGQVYLASGGLSPVADEAARAWISSAYGVPPKVWVVPDGALR